MRRGVKEWFGGTPDPFLQCSHSHSTPVWGPKGAGREWAVRKGKPYEWRRERIFWKENLLPIGSGKNPFSWVSARDSGQTLNQLSISEIGCGQSRSPSSQVKRPSSSVLWGNNRQLEIFFYFLFFYFWIRICYVEFSTSQALQTVLLC